jgi:hypothetical protein
MWKYTVVLLMIVLVIGCGRPGGKTILVSEDDHLQVRVLEESIHRLGNKSIACLMVVSTYDGKLSVTLSGAGKDCRDSEWFFEKKGEMKLVPVSFGDKIVSFDGIARREFTVENYLVNL